MVTTAGTGQQLYKHSRLKSKRHQYIITRPSKPYPSRLLSTVIDSNMNIHNYIDILLNYILLFRINTADPVVFFVLGMILHHQPDLKEGFAPA